MASLGKLLQCIKSWASSCSHSLSAPTLPTATVLNLAYLPPELLHYITSYLDRESLKQSRLTCRTISHIASSKLFETILTDEAHSTAEATLSPRMRILIERLKELPNLRDVILRFDVYFTAPDTDEDVDTDDDEVGEEDEESGVVWYPQTVPFRLETLQLLFSSLLSLSRPLRGLAIQNMQNICEQTPGEIATMAKVLCKLRSLRLHIVSGLIAQRC
ncbi:hypothetical protein BDV28DRAFT_149287 [Aspergillus coremiiformis]|uniref:F-box domain-containing protein n=1 Tax=Aspergillus coremiiformis TaxID=138285 RepID=A0A5N6Z393_9EURO|nr:hypothetical protein BDV28DRAFT_149287 [Aspergillus coremiiformis]